jgi:hypothetical protein
MRTVGLVGCGKTKLDHPAPARELYVGNLFRAAAAYADAAYDEWWILSAKHRVVHPDQVLEPYDLSMADLKPTEAAHWGLLTESDLRLSPSCADGLGRRMMRGEDVHLFFHCGVAYRAPLIGRIQWSRVTVHVPLEGLGIGEQLAWYAARRAAREVAM